MKVFPPHQSRNCINTVKLIDKHAAEYLSLISSPMPITQLHVDGLAVIESEGTGGLRLEALRKIYTLSLSYAYSGESGPLGVLGLQEVLPKEELGRPVMQVIFDGNGEVRYSDGTTLSMFDIGRQVPADVVRSNALYKILGAIIAALPLPPGAEGSSQTN
jgi:hypothetical protein